jgi:flagellar hook-basal body complex protein FliE
MSPVGLVSPLASSALARLDAPLPKISLSPPTPTTGAPADGFGQMLEGLVASVDAKQNAAQAVTRKVLLGETDQLHQSVIAMQEASVAFSMMVQVRNKLVESYQELMRMQA